MRARQLRRASQNAEWKLWHEVRNRKLRGLKIRRQHPIDRFFADFACVAARVVIELDGPHRDGQLDTDEVRTQIMGGCGWIVIRFANDRLDDDFSFDHLLREIGDTCETALGRDVVGG